MIEQHMWNSNVLETGAANNNFDNVAKYEYTIKSHSNTLIRNFSQHAMRNEAISIWVIYAKYDRTTLFKIQVN